MCHECNRKSWCYSWACNALYAPKIFPVNVHFKLFALSKQRMFFLRKILWPNNYFSLQPEGKCRIELQNYCDAITTYYHLSTSILVVMLSGLWCDLLQLLTIERRFYMTYCSTGRAFSFLKGNEFFPLHVCSIHTQAACTAVVLQTERRHLLFHQTEARHSIHMSSVPAFNAVFNRHNFLPAFMPSMVKLFVMEMLLSQLFPTF